MADKLSKQPENVPGQWYVDTSCALCRMCLEEAPNLITYNRDETAVHFFKQPETPRLLVREHGRAVGKGRRERRRPVGQRGDHAGVRTWPPPAAFMRPWS